MRFCLLFIVMLAAIPGCGTNDTTPQPQAFELEGAWLYLGPSDVPHTLTISRTSMAYADVDAHWSSNWTIKKYDNTTRQFQVVFSSGSGTYLPVGESMSGAYDVSNTFLTVQLTKDLASYPQLQSPGTCTATDGAPVLDCRLYVKN